MKRGVLALVLASAAVALFLALAGGRPMGGIREFLAAVFFVDSITTAELKATYARATRGQGKVQVLVVPGHDNDAGGTEFRGVHEADLTVKLGEHLAAFLKTEPAFSVTLARDGNGYHPALASYFETERDGTLRFIGQHKRTMDDLRRAGLVHPIHGVSHATARPEAALKLFGINRWANQNGVDIVLHLHFNDAARRPNIPGKYSGVAVYVPERQYSNAKASRAIAEAVFPELTRYYPISDLPGEDAGIVEDQELIAIGTANSLDAASLLIEYGYIYEPQFLHPKMRARVIEELAFQTSNGLRRFFGARDLHPSGTTLLPYEWKTDLEKGVKGSEAVLALQAALSREGFYPPSGHDRRACPLAGNFGFCTQSALRFFQAKYEIYGGDGSVAGPATRRQLNMLFSR